MIEADSSIAIYIEGSSFPNWNGVSKNALSAITGNQLTMTVHPQSGEPVDVTWKRAKSKILPVLCVTSAPGTKPTLTGTAWNVRFQG